MASLRRRVAGQALVEAALVMPVLILMTLGVLQVVLYAHARDVLLAATQDGARLAAEEGGTLTAGYARVQSLATAGLGSSVQPLQMHCRCDADHVDLSLDTALRPIVPLPFAADLPVHVRASVTRERFRPGGA
jgi:TadE-like protein